MLTIDLEDVSQRLIETIFMHTSPLHDGGVVIQVDRIAACGCLFPLTQNPSVSAALGTRHRAALGLAEETDAVCVVVSEETGGISVAADGKLIPNQKAATLHSTLSRLYRQSSQDGTGSGSLVGSRS